MSVITTQIKIPVSDNQPLQYSYISNFLDEKIIRWAITSIEDGYYILDCAIKN